MQKVIYHFEDGSFIFWTGVELMEDRIRYHIYRVRPSKLPEQRAKEKGFSCQQYYLAAPSEIELWLFTHPQFKFFSQELDCGCLIPEDVDINHDANDCITESERNRVTWTDEQRATFEIALSNLIEKLSTKKELV
jgi:hypothetical protein